MERGIEGSGGGGHEKGPGRAGGAWTRAKSGDRGALLSHRLDIQDNISVSRRRRCRNVDGEVELSQTSYRRRVGRRDGRRQRCSRDRKRGAVSRLTQIR